MSLLVNFFKGCNVNFFKGCNEGIKGKETEGRGSTVKWGGNAVRGGVVWGVM